MIRISFLHRRRFLVRTNLRGLGRLAFRAYDVRVYGVLGGYTVYLF